MLAPLEDRSVLTVRGCDEECAVEREANELRRLLRASRLRLRRSALQSTRQIVTLNAEIARLQKVCERQAVQIARYAAGSVVVDLGRRLMALSVANERLVEDSRRTAMLERVLGISEAERQRLVRERDAMARELAAYRRDALLGVPLVGGADAVAIREMNDGGEHVGQSAWSGDSGR
ncbi:MAG: hypothetical protein L6Q60_03860 [Rhodocyclaceae bacterium]|nr:hypothetical protein [Rhodocyclaceae bacterium]